MAKLTKRKKLFADVLKDEKPLSLDEAVKRLEEFPKVNFDETVEMHFMLNTNPKSSDQAVRGTVKLPHGTGKKVKIAVFCKGEHVLAAEKAGADYVGAAELIEKVAQGFMDFDFIVATPEMMRDISKLGKILGPRGLMPSPKAGTVTTDLERVIGEIKAGRVEFKADRQSGIHVGIGKRSFGAQQLQDNANCVLDAVNHAKPSSVKGALIKNLALSTTMGPGLMVTV